MNYYDNNNYLSHYGVLGMKWRIRSGEKKIDKLSKRTDKMIKKADRKGEYDRGELRDQSMKVRKLEYKNNKRILKIKKYLNNERLVDRIFDLNKDPKKIAKVKEHLAKSELQSKKISEVRALVNQVKMDLI